MGPEPLGPDFTAATLHAALAGRRAPIKALLLDQRTVAGLGNIYVCEALHMAGIAPSRAGGRISAARLARLVEAIRARSEEHTSELQSLMRISYAVFCLKKKKKYSHTSKQNNKAI